MAQVFRRSSTAFSRATLIVLAALALALAISLPTIVQSSYYTQADVVRTQPVQFSHEHHVAGLGIDCRYCHTTVETSRSAGMPATEVCMNCHSQIWADSPKLEPVRASFRSGKSLAWTRVHDLPDYVRFDHSIHVQKGVACAACHGRVDQMPLMWREHTLQMQWCLDCHRNPAPHLRPRDAVFAMDWQPSAEFNPAELLERYLVENVTTCSACHQ
jgi:hypothetical protein